jgi:hypothetical protein
VVTDHGAGAPSPPPPQLDYGGDEPAVEPEVDAAGDVAMDADAKEADAEPAETAAAEEAGAAAAAAAVSSHPPRVGPSVANPAPWLGANPGPLLAQEGEAGAEAAAGAEPAKTEEHM